jgi:hypothetical protein
MTTVQHLSIQVYLAVDLNCLADVHQRQGPGILALAAMPLDMLHLKPWASAFVLGRVGPCKYALHQLTALRRQLEAVLSAVLASFSAPASDGGASPEEDATAAAAAAAAFQAGNVALQLHALRFLERIVAAEPASLGALRRLGLWELVYGRAFFQLGLGEQQEQQVGVSGCTARADAWSEQGLGCSNAPRAQNPCSGAGIGCAA